MCVLLSHGEADASEDSSGTASNVAKDSDSNVNSKKRRARSSCSDSDSDSDSSSSLSSSRPARKTLPKRQKRGESKVGRPRRGVDLMEANEPGLCSLGELLLLAKKVLFITGAGISVASGIAPFRGSADAVWEQSVHEMGTRAKFEENPLKWYKNFWLHHFNEAKAEKYLPNEAHVTIAELCKLFPNVRVLTQNIDRLHRHSSGTIDSQLIEVHGFAGSFKCFTESCDYSSEKVHSQKLPENLRKSTLPRCPSCNAIMCPNCLLFDEDYTDHESYEFRRAKKWIEQAEVMVFVGTSFAVRLTSMATVEASSRRLPVFNFNLHNNFPEKHRSRAHLHFINGKAEESLPLLLAKFLPPRETKG